MQITNVIYVFYVMNRNSQPPSRSAQPGAGFRGIGSLKPLPATKTAPGARFTPEASLFLFCSS